MSSDYTHRDSFPQDPTINQPQTETPQDQVGIGGSVKPEDKGISETSQSILEKGSQFFENLKTSSKNNNPSIKQLDKTNVKKSIPQAISKAFNTILYKTSKTRATQADKANNNPASIIKHIEYMGRARGEKWDVKYDNQVFTVMIPNPEEGGEPATIKFTEAGNQFTRFASLGGESKKQISNSSYTSLIKDILKEDAIPTKVNYKAMIKELNALAETSPKVSVNSKGVYTVTLESNAKNPEKPEFDTHGAIQFSFIYDAEAESYEIVPNEGASEPDKLAGTTDTSLSCLLDKVVKSNTNRLDRTNAEQLCSMLATRLKDENPINVLQALSNLFNNDPLFNRSEKQLDGVEDQYSWAKESFPKGIENFTEYITNQILDGIEKAQVNSDKEEKKLDPTKEEKEVSSKVIKLTSMFHTELGSLRHRKPVEIEAGDGGKYIQIQGHVRVKDGHESASFDSKCGVLSAKLGTSVDPDDTQNMGFVIKENKDGSKEFIVGRTSRTDTPYKVKQNSLMHAQALIESGIAKLTYPPENNGKPTFEFQRTDVSMMDNNLMKAFLAGSKSRLEGKPPESEMAFLESKKSTINDMWNPDRGNVFQDDKGVYIIHEIEFLENKDDLYPTTYYAKEYKPIFANLSIGTFVRNDACDRIREENIPVFKDLFNSQLSVNDQTTLNKHIDAITKGTLPKAYDLDKLSEPVQALQTFLNEKGFKIDNNAMRNLEIALTGMFLGQPVAPEHQAISMALSLFEVSQAAGLTIGCECKSGNDRTQVFTSLALASKEFQAAHGKSFFFMEASPNERFNFLATFFDTVPKSGRPNLLAARGPNDASDLNSPPQIKTGRQMVFMKMYNEFEALGKELGKVQKYEEIDKQLTDNLFLKKKVDERLPNVIDQGSPRKIRSQIESAALYLKGAFQESITQKPISSETITKHLRKLGKAKGEVWLTDYNDRTKEYTVTIPESAQGSINFSFKKDEASGKYKIPGTKIQSASYSKLVSKYRHELAAKGVVGTLEENLPSISDALAKVGQQGSIKTLFKNEDDNEVEALSIQLAVDKVNKYDKELLKGIETPILNMVLTIDTDRKQYVATFPNSSYQPITSQSIDNLLDRAINTLEYRLDRSDVKTHLNVLKNQISAKGYKPEVVYATLKQMEADHPFFQDNGSYEFIQYEGSSIKDQLYEALGAKASDKDKNVKYSNDLYQLLQVELNTLVKRNPVSISVGNADRDYIQSQGLVYANENGILIYDENRGPGSSELGNQYNADELFNAGKVTVSKNTEEGQAPVTIINRSGRTDSVAKIDKKSIMEIHNQLQDGTIGPLIEDENGKKYYTFKRVDISLLDTDKLKSRITSVASRAEGRPEESERKFLANKAKSYESRWDISNHDTFKDSTGRVYIERKVRHPNDPTTIVTVREYKPVATKAVMGSILGSDQIQKMRNEYLETFHDILRYDVDLTDDFSVQTNTHYNIYVTNALKILVDGSGKSLKQIQQAKSDLKDALEMINANVDMNTIDNLCIAISGYHNGKQVSNEALALSAASALYSLSKGMGLSVGCECKSGNDRTQVYVSYSIAHQEYLEKTGESFCWANASEDEQFEFLTYFFESMPESAHSNLAASRGIHSESDKYKDEHENRTWIKIDTNVLFHKMRNTYAKIAESKLETLESQRQKLEKSITEAQEPHIPPSKEDQQLKDSIIQLKTMVDKQESVMKNLVSKLYFKRSGIGVPSSPVTIYRSDPDNIVIGQRNRKA